MRRHSVSVLQCPMAKKPKQVRKASGAARPPKKLWEPNRIAELRKERGWTLREFMENIEERTGIVIEAEQLGKLERRERKLSPEYLFPIAETLGVEPMELLDVAAMAGSTNDVEPREDGPHAVALAKRGLRYYKVITGSVAESGYAAGDTVLADETPEAVAAAKSGDLVVVEYRPGKRDALLLLRVFIAPSLLVTNRPKSNPAMKLGKNRIIAVVVSPDGNT